MPMKRSAALKDAAPYYTNSTRLPVDFSDDIFETLRLQDACSVNIPAVRCCMSLSVSASPILKWSKIWCKISNNHHLPYFTLTPTFSVCSSHGYLKGEQPVCPVCQSPTEVYSRVVGYLRPIKQWNDGKRSEYDRRKTFQVSEALEGKPLPEKRDGDRRDDLFWAGRRRY